MKLRASSALAVVAGMAASVASADVILSNYPQTNDTSTTADVDNLRHKALSFAMPGASPAYTVTSITLRLQNYVTPADVAVLEIRNHTGSTTAPGTTVVGTFVAPASAATAAGDFTFNPAGVVDLLPGTSYWIALRGADTVTSFDWRGSSPAITPTGIATYGGQSLFTTNAGTSWTTSATINTFRIEGVPSGGVFGACCLGAPAYNCIIATPAGCTAASGTYLGDGSACASCPPPPQGACCADDGTCTSVSELACITAGGVYQGNASECTGQCVAFGYNEASGPEAGELPSNAAFILGPANASLTRIRGTFAASDMDTYAIQICDEGNFQASTVGGSTADTQLFLFDGAGKGVVMGDDNVAPLPVSPQTTITSQFVLANGLYYLSVGGYNRDPIDGTTTTTQLLWNNTAPGGGFGPEWAPNGPGAANAVAGWTGTHAVTGAYTITLAGTCFVNGTFGACCLGAPSYSCTVTTAAGCTQAGGTYAGDNITCPQANCPPPPTGACCSFTGTCTVVTQAACLGSGGTYQGNTVPCGSCPSVPPVVYSNCNLPTGPTTLSGVAAPAASLWSECARDETTNTLTNTVAGFGLSGALRLADDFVVPAGGMNLAYVKVYAYTTGAVTPSATAATLRILDGSPVGAPNVVFGDQITNRMAHRQFSSIYRCFPTTVGLGSGAPCVNAAAGAPDTTRRLQEIFITVNQFLPAGTYWLDYNTTGTTFAPPATQTDAIGRQCDPGNSNGLQFNVSWVPLNDGGHGCFNGVAVTAAAPVNSQQDMYFELLGTVGGSCYANCDGSTGSPLLTANDFQCFANSYAAGSSTANCDGSTGNPLLTANDFQCFANAYAAGCS